MDDPIGSSARRCQSTRGVILVTPCQGVAVDHCFRCGIRLCLEHAVSVQGGVLCPQCAATGATYVTRDSAASDSPSDSISTDTADTDKSNSHEPPIPTATAEAMPDDDLFSDADYDAFDSAGDADMNAGISDGFDS